VFHGREKLKVTAQTPDCGTCSTSSKPRFVTSSSA
jgi:hypothetical protein